MGRINWIEAPPIIEERKEVLETWINECVRSRGYVLSLISYRFLNNRHINEMNQEVLDHDYPTDIITFDYSKSLKLKVDLAIGYEMVEESARTREVEVLEEYCRVLIHGLLHCMGWNDSNDRERLLMREEEEKCLLSRPN